ISIEKIDNNTARILPKNLVLDRYKVGESRWRIGRISLLVTATPGVYELRGPNRDIKAAFGDSDQLILRGGTFGRAEILKTADRDDDGNVCDFLEDSFESLSDGESFSANHEHHDHDVGFQGDGLASYLTSQGFMVPGGGDIAFMRTGTRFIRA